MASRARTAGTVLFISLMLVLTVVFIALGLWQLARLSEKEALAELIAERLTTTPIELPPSAQWPDTDWLRFEFQPVTVTGHYVPGQTVLVFTSLSEPKGQQNGPGYWVMTPLAIDGGGSIFINRGFVPETSRTAFAGGGDVEPGPVTLTGVARITELPGTFTPVPDTANRIEWLRDVERLARFTDPSLAPFAPIYVDLPAGASGALPQGGETVVVFPNNHFGYALTWLSFALLTPILLIVWLIRRDQPTKPTKLAP
jgi:surfeit locus 1 family protein